ncbi:MAG: glycosyltransferase [Chitinophagales bacterium]|nr:glycosyltransferase [Chitinophagaceae bacterium]MCB9064339.1 glycosyltransferase [Chitinophagales bacterium]
MPVLAYIGIVLSLIYAVLMLIYRAGWGRQAYFKPKPGFRAQTSISVIIPARNEEDNIGSCIEAIRRQNYPEELYEIIVVDDHSTDGTADSVKSLLRNNIHYINLEDELDAKEVTNAYKKRALSCGIAKAKGNLIVTTDADCIAKENWLLNIAALYQRENSKLVIMPVDFTSNGSVVETFQSLDFMSMQGITVASYQMNLGNMCNGANLAFDKVAYHEVGGYDGIDHIASGDDYLLMMKLKKRYPTGISYLKSEEVIVSTAPQPDWAGFFGQRVRWASKSGKYDDKKLTYVLAFAYIYNLLFVTIALLSVSNSIYLQPLFMMFVLKLVSELIYLMPVARFFKKQRQLLLFPLFEPVHMLYVVLAGFFGAIGVYSWKGRTVR